MAVVCQWCHETHGQVGRRTKSADGGFDYVYFHIYTKDGELVHSTQTRVNGIHAFQRQIILTAEGHVALIRAKPARVFILC